MRKFVTVLLLVFAHFANAQSVDNEKRKIENQINEASSSFSKAEYEKSLDLSKKALVRAFKINDDYLIAYAYNAIGVVYDEFSDSKRAIEFYNKALAHANNIENDRLKNWIYGNLGSSYYFSKNDPKEGLHYYKKSLEYALKINDSTQIAYTKQNIASAFFAISDFKTGIRYVNDVQDFVDRKGEQEAKYTQNSLLGIYNSNTNQPQAAEDYFHKAIGIAETNKLKNFLVNAYDNLQDHYSR